MIVRARNRTHTLERTSERALERTLEQTSEHALGQSFAQVIEQAFEEALCRGCDRALTRGGGEPIVRRTVRVWSFSEPRLAQTLSRFGEQFFLQGRKKWHDDFPQQTEHNGKTTSSLPACRSPLPAPSPANNASARCPTQQMPRARCVAYCLTCSITTCPRPDWKALPSCLLRRATRGAPWGQLRWRPFHSTLRGKVSTAKTIKGGREGLGWCGHRGRRDQDRTYSTVSLSV